MSVEDRLHALVQQCRQQSGDGFLRVPAQLIPRLSSQAPDLHGEIRALAAAIESDAATSIAAAADPQAEAMRIAGDIAGRERLSMTVVEPAVAVVRRLGPISAAAPAGGGWAGETMVAQPHAPTPAAPAYQAAPAYAPAPAAPQQPAAAVPPWQNKWVLGAVALAALAYFYQSQQAPSGPPQSGPVVPDSKGRQVPQDPQGPQRGPQQGPQGPQGPQQGPVAQGPQSRAPLLRRDGNLPVVPITRTQNGSYMMSFHVETQSGPSLGTILIPANGWDAGPTLVGFARPGSQSGQLDTTGQAMFQLTGTQNGPARVGQPQWQQDNVGFGNICIAFQGQPGQQDVTDSATMCIMDSACQQAAGCGRVQ